MKKRIGNQVLRHYINNLPQNCEIVSSDVDGLSTSVIGGRMVKVMAWYDNEYGYSQRLL